MRPNVATHSNTEKDNIGSTEWSIWLEQKIDSRDPHSWKADQVELIAKATEGRRSTAFVDPQLVDLNSIVGEQNLQALLAEADDCLEARGYLHNGKWNASVQDKAEALLDSLDFPDLILSLSGVRVSEPHTATYIEYRDLGQFLSFHVDSESFSDVSLIICLRHQEPEKADPSATAFVTSSGVSQISLLPGQAILFDGFAFPHARTPVKAGEVVTLILFGMRCLDQQRDTQAATFAPIEEAETITTHTRTTEHGVAE